MSTTSDSPRTTSAPTRTPPRKSIARRLGAIFGFVLLGAVIWGAVEGVSAAVALMRRLDSDLSKTLLAGATALIGSVASLAVGKAYEVRAAIKKELREKKAPVYDEIVATLFRVFFNEKIGKPPMTELEVMQFFAKTTEKLTIWGADDVLRSFARFREGTTGTPESIFLFEDLLFAIRRDLGHGNRNLARGAILRLFINDLDDFLKKTK